MPDPLNLVVSDPFAAGGMLATLKLARWCLANPDYVAGRAFTPPAFFYAIGMLHHLVWNAIDDAADATSSHGHADAVAEALGLVGVIERANAIEHHRRIRSAGADAIVGVVDGQLEGAITRLKTALADPDPASN